MDIIYNVNDICGENSHILIENKRRKQICYNPVEEHLIMLRQNSFDLNDLICKAEQFKIDQQHTLDRKDTELRPFSIQNYPENYPFSGFVSRPNVRVKFKGLLQEEKVAKLIQHFVECILTETGYFVRDSQMYDSDAVEQLIDLTNRFLKTFIFLLRRNKYSKVFSHSEDLWGPLETTLQEIGFGGICGLHKFYYEKIVRKHDVLLSEYKANLDSYNVLRTQLQEQVKSVYEPVGAEVLNAGEEDPLNELVLADDAVVTGNVAAATEANQYLSGQLVS